MHMCVSASGGWERASAPLELHLLVVCELPVMGSGNQISALVIYSLSASIEMIMA